MKNWVLRAEATNKTSSSSPKPSRFLFFIFFWQNHFFFFFFCFCSKTSERSYFLSSFLLKIIELYSIITILKLFFHQWNEVNLNLNEHLLQKIKVRSFFLSCPFQRFERNKIENKVNQKWVSRNFFFFVKKESLKLHWIPKIWTYTIKN